MIGSKGFNAVVYTRGTVADAADLAEFAARSFSDAFQADNDPDDLQAHLESTYGLQQQTDELIDPNVITILARANGELLAYAQVRKGTSPSCVIHDNAVELHRFYVDRSAHGRGLAQDLMQEVRSAALEFEAQHLWLGVWGQNSRGIAFYQKERFVDVGGKIYTVGSDDQEDRVLVAKLDS